MKRLMTSVFALFLVACGGSDTVDDKTAAEQTFTGEKTSAVSDYPQMTTDDGRTVWQPPFSAAEIREGTPDGLQQHIVMRERGQRFVIRVSFANPDATGVTVANVPVDGNGDALGEGTSARTTWAELETHAYYDVGNTTVEKTTITTSMGEHDALLFTQTVERDGVTLEERSWFALDLPGAPVRYEKTVDGTQAVTMEIVDRGVVEEETAQ